MLDWLQPTLGLVSASLVALIAIGFGAMFLFFSASAALVLGQFLRFARAPRVAATTIGAVVAVTALLGFLAGGPTLWAGPLVYGGACSGAYALLRFPVLGRWAQRLAGAGLLAAGALYAFSLASVSLAGLAQRGLAATAVLLVLGMVGFAPLVVAGLVQHARERPVEWFLSLRYLVARRRQTFISVISVICVMGVALGVAVITVVLSVMNGFSAVWEQKIVGNRAHFVVQSQLGPYADYRRVRGVVADIPGVVGATPFLMADAILRSEDGSIRAVLLKGIDPETVGEATDLPKDMIEGSLDDLDPDPDGIGTASLPGLVIGIELANQFLLRVGDPLILISPMGGARTPLGPAPRLVRFRVAGVFRADFFQFDESFVYTNLPGAQRFIKAGDVVTGIGVRTEDAYRSGAIGLDVELALDSGLFYVRDWKEFYPGFFQALKTERAMMFVLLSFIMVVAGFIIVATLIMMIMEKSRDIAILKAMGCEDAGVLRIFAIGGVLIGLAGLALGLSMGLVITWNLDIVQGFVEQVLGFDVLPPDVYQLEQLPFDVDPLQIGIVSAIAMVLSVGATLLPSWQASRLDPAEVLRYE